MLVKSDNSTKQQNKNSEKKKNDDSKMVIINTKAILREIERLGDGLIDEIESRK